MTTVSPFNVRVEQRGVNWNEELRARLAAFKEKYGWSPAQISRAMQLYFGRGKGEEGRAKNVGMGETYVWNYLNCKWISSQEKLVLFEQRVCAWLDHREAGGKAEDIDQDVKSARLIQHGLVEANDSRKFVTIIGPSGMGKTLIAKHFANLNTRGGMVIVESYDGMTPRAFLAALCRALGDLDTGSKDRLLMRAAGLLAEQPRLLAIDEANFLKDESINHLVYVWNHAQSGIVLLGTQELEQAIRSSRLQRVQSRTKVSINLGTLTDEEIRKRLAESFDAGEVTEGVVRLARIGSFGRYRDLDTLIDTVSDNREKNPNGSLEKLFERFSTRQEGKKKG